MSRCPGQDPTRWRPDDVFEAECVHCRAKVEFWKDDPVRTCPECRQETPNPKLDMGCAEWCKAADQCLALAGGKSE